MPQLLEPLPLLSLLLVTGTLGDGVFTIHNANDFIEFSNNVNSGVNYSGTTVFLDADLDFSGGLSQQFEPVGKDDSNYFLGTFDGQGYTISNLAVTSSSNYFGLFGRSKGLTIRNTAIDGSCSFTSNFTGNTNVRVGGIIGYCSGRSGFCTIENNVNMGGVAFNGNATGDSEVLFLGGIAGFLYSSSSYGTTVKNCANYGFVTHSGEIVKSRVGGIVGQSSGSSSSSYIYIQNCLNYGTIIHNGTTSNSLHIGGIVAFISYTSIENCVSAGDITSNKVNDISIGSILGYVSPSSSITNITHSFWTSDVGYDTAYGTGSDALNVDDETSQFEVNASLVDSLNSYSARNSTWTGWLLNANNMSVAFKVNDGRGSAVETQMILLPSPADNSERTFSGWYSDEGLTAALGASAVGSDTTLYGMFCGSSNYTVTLDVDGWDGLTVSSITVECNGTYAQLPDGSMMERSGYAFTGWFNDVGESVTNETTALTPRNHTLHAQWEEVTAQVEIVFVTKNLSRESVIEILKQYTGADFTIVSIDGNDDDGEGTRVIIKFVGKDDAERFYVNARSAVYSRADSQIKRIGFVSDDNDDSLSPFLYPAILSLFLMV